MTSSPKEVPPASTIVADQIPPDSQHQTDSDISNTGESDQIFFDRSDKQPFHVEAFFKSRHRIFAMSGVAVVLLVISFLSFPQLCSSAHWFHIQSLLNSARNGSPNERSKSIAALRLIASHKDLLSDNYRGGGLHAAVKEERDLFFKITGRSQENSSAANNIMEDRSIIGGTVVGPKTRGLCLTNSRINANIDAATRSSSIDWTLIFRNRSRTNAEARLEMELPEGAVVSQATLWINSKPQEAVVAPYNTARTAYQTVVRRSSDPLLVSLSSNNRVMVQCFPVPASGAEMKIRIGIIAPLSVAAANRCSLQLPRIAESNFREPKNCNITLSSTSPFVWGCSNDARKIGKIYCIDKKIKQSGQSSSQLSCVMSMTANDREIAVRDPGTEEKGKFIIQRLVAAKKKAPDRIFVVIDTSSLMKMHREGLRTAISTIPKSCHPAFYFVTEGESNVPSENSVEQLKPLNAADAVEFLSKEKYIGGKDNGPTLREILERASEKQGSEVLWIHGPQPSSQEPEKFLEFVHSVRLWDCQLEKGPNEISKSLSEEHLGKLLEISFLRPANYRSLEGLITSWKTEHQNSSFDLSRETKAIGFMVNDPVIAKRVACIWAKEEIERLLAAGLQTTAEAVACKYHIVSPISAAVVLESEADYKTFNLDVNAESARLFYTGEATDTYRGMHQYFKDDLVGNLFANIGQLIGKWLSEFINIDCAIVIDKLAELVICWSLPPTGITAKLMAFCLITEIVLIPSLLLCGRKVKRSNAFSPSQIAQYAKIFALMLGYGAACSWLIGYGASFLMAMFQIDVGSLHSLGYAITETVRDGLIESGSTTTSFFAPLLSNLPIPIAGQFIGQTVYFLSIWIFALLLVVMIILLTIIFVMLFLRQTALIIQFGAGPVFIGLDSKRYGQMFLKALLEISLWTVCWFAVLKILCFVSFSILQPWGKVVLISALLFSMIVPLPKLFARAKIGPIFSSMFNSRT